ncbi:hypothetical protein LBMAG42_33000 [Deltaproteobacteria bacterium]|nr:hypothetical protein LBMAG42_33000 [Deltaproteobacteria bacterium]
MGTSGGRVVRFVALLGLMAGCGDASGGSDTAPVDDEGKNPVAPNEYEDAWDIDALTCPDGAMVYWAFDGAIDDNGGIKGEETWYWFFAAEGSAGDCSDTFSINGEEGETKYTNDPCNTCDRDFTTDMVEDESKHRCTQFADGYENLLDNDDVDRIDEEAYQLLLMLDTDPLGGEAGDVQVWTFVQDDQSNRDFNDRSLGIGTFTPEDGVDGPGDLTYASDGLCVTITEE